MSSNTFARVLLFLGALFFVWYAFFRKAVLPGVQYGAAGTVVGTTANIGATANAAASQSIATASNAAQAGIAAGVTSIFGFITNGVAQSIGGNNGSYGSGTDTGEDPNTAYPDFTQDSYFDDSYSDSGAIDSSI